jgi:hypothetical protein
MTPHTTNQLLARGFNFAAANLRQAADRCFNARGPDGKSGALYSTDETTEHFWNRFVEAHRCLYRDNDMQEAA